MTKRPLAIDEAFVDELRRDGLEDLAMREAANVGFHYNLINRVADAFDFPVPAGKEKARLAGLLNLAGKVLKGGYADEVWTRGEGSVIRPTEVEHGRAHLLSVEGETSPELRRAVEAFVVRQWGVERVGAPPLPADLEPYLKKLARDAYKIVDDDVTAVSAAGYSKDALYEITIVGAFAAGLVGLEQLFTARYSAA